MSPSKILKTPNSQQNIEITDWEIILFSLQTALLRVDTSHKLLDCFTQNNVQSHPKQMQSKHVDIKLKLITVN